MDGQGSRWKAKLNLMRLFKRGGEDSNLVRIRRRRTLYSLIGRRMVILKLALFLAGYIWMLAIPSAQLDRGVYFDENALQPGQANTYWNWKEVHDADRFLEQLEQLRETNATSEQRSQLFLNEFRTMGLPASAQKYQFTGINKDINGTNVYAVLSSPRASGVEAMVISASWLSRTNEGDGTLNLRGVATVLALSRYLKQYSFWAKDLIFIISDGYMDGMQAWLNAYHGATQSNLRAQRLDIPSGVIWTALNIDYPGHSLSDLGIFHEGLNGRLPNQDLINTFQHISRRTGVPVVLYDHKDPPTQLKWLPDAARNHPEIKTYAAQAQNLWRHLGYQASGRGSGVHGLFHQYRIDAFTMFALPATGPHGFYSLGRIIEGTLRSTNNLLERLHASFFFYLMTTQDRFVKIGNYLPSAVLISVAMMFGGLQVWVGAAWTRKQREPTENDDEKKGTLARARADADIQWEWERRKRPVLRALGIIIATHLFGAGIFFVLSSTWYSSLPFTWLIPCSLLYVLPLVGSRIISQSQSQSQGQSHSDSDSDSNTIAPLSLVLKALNLCLSSTVISIITVLNFSLAACLAVVLGVPLSISSPSSSSSSSSIPGHTNKNTIAQIAKYSAYLALGAGWIASEGTTQRMIWNWDVLGVWLLPFLCTVYLPLVLQAALVCVI